MKKKAIQFVPLDRKARPGDYLHSDVGGYEGSFLRVMDDEHADWLLSRPSRDKTAYERREVEVEVEDPVPEWLHAAICIQHPSYDSGSWVWATERAIADAYRAHVEAKAKAAAGQIDGVSEFTRTVIERIIRECFLEDR